MWNGITMNDCHRVSVNKTNSDWRHG